MAVLSVPSWVIPGTYTENLRFLENKKEIRGVELLFFIFDDEEKKLLDSELETLYNYRERFIFTAHVPESLRPDHEYLIARLSPLVRHFIVHQAVENQDARTALLEKWTQRYGAAFLTENRVVREPSGSEQLPIKNARLGGLSEKVQRQPTGLSNKSNISVEKKDSPLEVPPPRADGKPDLCLDTGHLLLDGQSPADYFKAWGTRVGEIHLHSVDREKAAIDGRPADHRQLREDEPWLLELFPLLKDFQGVINLEVFAWEEAAAGIEVLRKLIYENRTNMKDAMYGKH